MKKYPGPPKKPKSVKFVKQTNILTGEKTKGSIYGRGAKNWANKIRDFYNSGKSNLKWKTVEDSDIVNNRRVKTYTVVPIRNKKKGKR